jgi:L-asparagine transporter-like permease
MIGNISIWWIVLYALCGIFVASVMNALTESVFRKAGKTRSHWRRYWSTFFSFVFWWLALGVLVIVVGSVVGDMIADEVGIGDGND